MIAGSGPAGAVAACVLARGGARVLLADPSRFPRDKACGDVVGPRGKALLDELGLLPEAAAPAGDVVLTGPRWHSVRLPWPAGKTYPTGAIVVKRETLDGGLHAAASAAGAEIRAARVQDVGTASEGVCVRLSDGSTARAAFVIGGDGALSRVATAAGLLRPERALWGFALRAYVAGQVDAPHIVFWAPDGRRPLPGYGWAFPAGPGQVNLGVGLGLRGARGRAAAAADLLLAFTRALEQRGMLQPGTRLEARRGGWMRMGLAGCVPAAGRVLLTGDAAGLVNPLQGEGISEAIGSGRAAAEAILQRPGDAAAAYASQLARAFGEFQAIAGAAQEVFLARARLRTLVATALTAPVAGRAAAPGLATWWNDLLDGAVGPGLRRATALALAVRLATLGTGRRRERLQQDPLAVS